ncbi:hypothetical protein FB565_005455 [Actinoplanes lutulentus]|uniref:YbaB/EbfC DNA-binding family protein n=1 Tax=Actinoplanes lutulentus TaxID=1287878 RepID=A0A327ZBF2_9ACTN|nr:hypothetical protein [Actinoplanes lutulentus]MBB2945697.1 hypothetical protein [Actinoplanes lutulentus]RAK37746.1 hypothetical protein B0I29_10612 [Actinoplanes lutulentus]
MDANYVVTGEAAGGWIRVELAEDGRLWDLALDPRVTSLPVSELRDGLMAAFSSAQLSLPFACGEAFEEQVADASAMAERRFAEISTALYDICRRADRP